LTGSGRTCSRRPGTRSSRHELKHNEGAPDDGRPFCFVGGASPALTRFAGSGTPSRWEGASEQFRERDISDRRKRLGPPPHPEGRGGRGERSRCRRPFTTTNDSAASRRPPRGAGATTTETNGASPALTRFAGSAPPPVGRGLANSFAREAFLTVANGWVLPLIPKGEGAGGRGAVAVGRPRRQTTAPLRAAPREGARATTTRRRCRILPLSRPTSRSEVQGEGPAVAVHVARVPSPVRRAVRSGRSERPTGDGARGT
jgi:hypothetical protein